MVWDEYIPRSPRCAHGAPDWMFCGFCADPPYSPLPEQHLADEIERQFLHEVKGG